MQTCPCPSCGALLPLSLASVHGVRCRSCGYEGQPRAEALERLRTAHGELARLDQRSRQLDAAGRAAIGRALRTRWGALVVLAIGALPFVGLSAMGLMEGIAHDGPLPNRIFGVFFICVPMLVYGGVGGILAAVVGQARRRLLAASAAIPPARPGEPIACAICGAALVSRGVEPIARCAYCAADNVVHPAALAEATATRSVDIDAIGATTAKRAHEAFAAARHASAMGAASFVGAPAASFVCVLGMLLGAKAIEPRLALAPSPIARYSWVETKRGRCVALIAHREGVTKAHFGGNDRLPNPMTLDELPPRFTPSTLVGRRMRLSDGTRGRVGSITGAPVTNREQLVLDSGAHGDLPGACADE